MCRDAFRHACVRASSYRLGEDSSSLLDPRIYILCIRSSVFFSRIFSVSSNFPESAVSYSTSTYLHSLLTEMCSSHVRHWIAFRLGRYSDMFGLKPLAMILVRSRVDSVYRRCWIPLFSSVQKVECCVSEMCPKSGCLIASVFDIITVINFRSFPSLYLLDKDAGRICYVRALSSGFEIYRSCRRSHHE